jgi:hypothetical protein
LENVDNVGKMISEKQQAMMAYLEVHDDDDSAK